jgi:hypothetical protein
MLGLWGRGPLMDPGDEQPEGIGGGGSVSLSGPNQATAGKNDSVSRNDRRSVSVQVHDDPDPGDTSG